MGHTVDWHYVDLHVTVPVQNPTLIKQIPVTSHMAMTEMSDVILIVKLPK